MGHKIDEMIREYENYAKLEWWILSVLTTSFVLTILVVTVTNVMSTANNSTGLN